MCFGDTRPGAKFLRKDATVVVVAGDRGVVVEDTERRSQLYGVALLLLGRVKGVYSAVFSVRPVGIRTK